MSYILEALRKADAERERGAVPDLQSQLLPGSPADDEPVRRARRGWLWPTLAAGLVGLGGVLFWFFSAAPESAGRATVAGAPPAGSAPMAAASVVAAAPAVTSTAALPASAPPALPEAAPPPQKAEAPRQRKPPAAAAKPAPTPPAKAAVTKERRPAVPSAPAVATAPSPPPSAPATLVLRLNELPEDLRRQVPTLVVGGSIYSPQPDKRMVIFNGQVFNEGTMLTPELRLEQIRAKSAVLSIRGQRFELPL